MTAFFLNLNPGMEDYYKVLGIKRGSSLKEISAAYRSQALIYHPDKRKSSSDDNETFFKIKAAYQALQDPKIRAELDLQLIGQEERLKRDSQMSAQRKRMKEDLLNREKDAMNPNKLDEKLSKVQQKNHQYGPSISNVEASLALKCKFPQGTINELEMIKISLNCRDEDVILFKNPPSINSFRTTTTIIAQFKDSQTAYNKLLELPNDLIVKADWYGGYPPDIKLDDTGSFIKKSLNNNVRTEEKKVRYSKEMEESILERLKRKKQEMNK